MLIHGINHIVLKVRDLEASDRFYREILNLRLVGQRPGMRFYSAGAHHHDLALMQVGAGAAVPGSHETGLAHFCLDVVDEAALVELYRKCLGAGIAVSDGVDHRVMRAFYILDPDGHVVELGVDMPVEHWGNDSNPYSVDKPYSLDVASQTEKKKNAQRRSD